MSSYYSLNSFSTSTYFMLGTILCIQFGRRKRKSRSISADQSSNHLHYGVLDDNEVTSTKNIDIEEVHILYHSLCKVTKST